MNRPWKIWLGFAICFAVLISVIAGVSVTALRSDRARQRAEAEANLEEKVRLALWRMDSMLAPLIAQESARPWTDYSPSAIPRPAETTAQAWIPAPVLSQPSSNILLHFQLDREWRMSSPQVPTSQKANVSQAQPLAPEQSKAASARLKELDLILKGPSGGDPAPDGAAQQPFANGKLLFDAVASSMTNVPFPGNTRSGQAISSSLGVPALAGALQKAAPQQASRFEQIYRNDAELGARAQSVQNAVELNFENLAKNRFQTSEQAMEGPMRPVWLGEQLLLARRVVVGGQELVQGCWLDWPGLRGWLLGNVRDLLPNASLQRLSGSTPENHGRALASLPARLVPGAAVSGPQKPSAAIMTALVLGWACVLLAGAAMAALLYGTLALSERRAAFVSAVTHELRTPLTTFKMYSEMLAGGMVRDERKRQEYLLQMCSEADRLHHLVENVLAYARLERGSARTRTERLTLGDLIQRVKPRLEQRAGQASMIIKETADSAAQGTVVEVDVSTVEQILFNLVDNACKYAAPFSEDKTIYIEAVSEAGKSALVRVRDSGQGISPEAAERLFQPFSKTAQQAAGSVPGVGLGLALCRGLGRSMGGELRLGRGNGKGACFELSLPIA